jgi:Uma2 family endonuclease
MPNTATLQAQPIATFTPVEEPIPMSYEEYLAWDEEHRIIEWHDGKAIVHMPPSKKHQEIAEFLSRLISLFVRMFSLGSAHIPPFEVRLPQGLGSREPDLFFVSTANQDKFDAHRFDGAPDLIVEIVSDSSVSRDRQEKFRAYEAAGVAEYWIIDPRPNRRHADFFRLVEDGRYELFATADDEIVRSHLLADFWLRPEWLWQDPLPDVLGILAQVVGMETLIAHIRQSSTAQQTETT